MKKLDKIFDMILAASPVVFAGFAVYGLIIGDGEVVFQSVVLSFLCMIGNKLNVGSR